MGFEARGSVYKVGLADQGLGIRRIIVETKNIFGN